MARTAKGRPPAEPADGDESAAPDGKPGHGINVRPRLRVFRGDVIVFGPGKADLIDAIRATGSIRNAAARLGMSYMRAWHLVQTMNSEFRSPVILTARGGDSRGGASVTPTGERVLGVYREMEAASAKAVAPAWRRMKPYLKA